MVCRTMFRPRNIYSVLTPMYYSTKIFGLTPFSIQNKRFKKSKINLFCSIALMIFLNTYTSLGLGKRLDSSDEKFITRVTDYAAAYLTQLNMCFGILFGCIFVNKVLTVIEDISQFDKNARMNYGIDLLKEYRKTKIYITITLIITIIYVLLVVGLSAFPARSLFTLELIGEFMAYVAPEVINSFIEFQFCTLILSLKQRFNWLNKTVRFVSQSLDNKQQKCDHIFFVAHDYRIPPTTPIVFTGFMQDQALFIIEKIRIHHHDLCTISKRVNKAYSMQILLIVVTTFTTIIVLVYYAGRHILTDTYLELDYLLYCFAQISLALIQVVTLVKVCSNTCVEARKTGALIHNVISMQQQYKCKDDLQLGISAFSLQLLHQNVEFTACGMFVIDETLLFSIVGAITTYLVIVIQFEVSDRRKS